MYEPFFGFHRRPFSPAPDPACFYAGESVSSVLDELTTCVERGQGIALLTAPAGMGKSLLCQRLIANLKGRFATIYLSNANFPTRRSLLQAILLELGDEHPRSDEAELRHTLQKRLHGLRRHHEALLLVVDEAHLFETPLLEEIRTLADIVADGTPLVRIVLSGQLELEERLTDRHFDALNQRLGTHAYLEPLTQAESAEYLHHHMGWAGGDAETVFSEEAFSIVVRASGGVPRCLNQLADHSLIVAFAANERPVSEKTVCDALEDVKQLPLHWVDVGAGYSSDTFGTDDGIRDDDSEADAALNADDAAFDFASDADDYGIGPEPVDSRTAEPSFSDWDSGAPAAELHPRMPANAAALAAAAEAFDATDSVTDSTADEGTASPAAATHETGWDAKHESAAGESTPADDDAWFAGASSSTATDMAAEIGSGHSDATPASEAVTAPQPAVLEFGADLEPAIESSAADKPALETSAAQPSLAGEAPVEAVAEPVAEPVAEVVETFVEDHYSNLEEPLSADIVWPPSPYFSRQAEAAAEAAETPTATEADAPPTEMPSPVDAAADDVTAPDTPAVQPAATSVFEFSAEADAEAETADDVESSSTPTEGPVAQALPHDTVSADASAPAGDDDVAGDELLADSHAEPTMFEFGVDPHSDTSLETTGESATTYEQGESLLTEFGQFDVVEPADAEPADAEPADADAIDSQPDDAELASGADAADDATSTDAIDADASSTEEPLSAAADQTEDAVHAINPTRAIDTIGKMLDELVTEEGGDASPAAEHADAPERSSIEIESELLQSVDHSGNADRTIEDEIGETMLDICLDTQSAVYELSRQLQSPTANDVVEEQQADELPQIADVDPAVFDVVEPEASRSANSESPQHSERASQVDRRPQQLQQKRPFGSLFSDLRRRQR